MVSPKSQHQLIFENKDASNEDKLKLLDVLIEKSRTNEELVPYYSKRIFIYFQMERYNDVLSDIELMEKHTPLNESHLLIKWKATLCKDIAKFRESVSQTINLRGIDNQEHWSFLNNISNENISRILKNKKQKRPSVKRLIK